MIEDSILMRERRGNGGEKGSSSEIEIQTSSMGNERTERI